MMNGFSFSPSDIAYLRTVLPHCEEAFFVWLGQLDCRNVRLYALEEGLLCFPRVPLIRVEVGGGGVGNAALRAALSRCEARCRRGGLFVAQPVEVWRSSYLLSGSRRSCFVFGGPHGHEGALWFVRGVVAIFVPPACPGVLTEHTEKCFFLVSTSTPCTRTHAHTKTHPTRPAPALVPPVWSPCPLWLFPSHCLFIATSTQTGPTSGGAASGNPVAEPHQLPVADRHERCEVESGGRRRQDTARVRTTAGAGTYRSNSRGGRDDSGSALAPSLKPSAQQRLCVCGRKWVHLGGFHVERELHWRHCVCTGGGVRRLSSVGLAS